MFVCRTCTGVAAAIQIIEHVSAVRRGFGLVLRFSCVRPRPRPFLAFFQIAFATFLCSLPLFFGLGSEASLGPGLGLGLNTNATQSHMNARAGKLHFVSTGLRVTRAVKELVKFREKRRGGREE